MPMNVLRPPMPPVEGVAVAHLWLAMALDPAATKERLEALAAAHAENEKVAAVAVTAQRDAEITLADAKSIAAEVERQRAEFEAEKRTIETQHASTAAALDDREKTVAAAEANKAVIDQEHERRASRLEDFAHALAQREQVLVADRTAFDAAKADLDRRLAIIKSAA